MEIIRKVDGKNYDILSYFSNKEEVFMYRECFQIGNFSFIVYSNLFEEILNNKQNIKCIKECYYEKPVILYFENFDCYMICDFKNLDEIRADLKCVYENIGKELEKGDYL